MQEAVVSVVGQDCPGVVHAVSNTLTELRCNIEGVSQTILRNQFAAIFIATLPAGLALDELERLLAAELERRHMPLSLTTRPMGEGNAFEPGPCEPFVVTVDGNDRQAIVSSISGMFAEHQVSIENLKAIRPDEAPSRCILVFEIALPLSIDRTAFRQTLQARAADLGLSLSIQHRDIFEAVNRIPAI